MVSSLWKSASETFALMGLFALMAGETVVEGGAYLFTGNSATPGEPYFMTRKYFETLTGVGISGEIDKQIEPLVDNKEAYRLASIVGSSLVTAADFASMIWGLYEFAARIGVKVLSGKSGVSLIDDIANDSSKAIKAGDELGETVIKGAGKGFEPPKIYTNSKGQMTNGTHTIDSAGMSPHTNGSTTSGKSQFLSNVDANKAVLDGAAYADKYNLWNNGKAKVYVENGPVGVHGGTGELTNWLNIYKTKTGFVHGAPATP